MKFLRTLLLLSVICFTFLAKSQEICTLFYKYHLPSNPIAFVVTETITIPDIAKKYIDGKEQNYTQTLLFNFVGSGTFATLNSTGLFNKFKDKIVQGAKKLPLKTVLPASVKAKVDVLKEKIYEKATQTVLAVQKRVVSKKQVSNKLLTESKIIPEPECDESASCNQSLR